MEDALQKLRGYCAKKLLIFLGGWWQGTYRHITVGFKWFSDVQPCCQGFLLTFDYPPITVNIWSEGSFVNLFSCWLKSTFKENDHNGVSLRSKLGWKRFRFAPTKYYYRKNWFGNFILEEKGFLHCNNFC